VARNGREQIMSQASPQPPAGTALITGASSGIGYEISLLLARQGYNLVLVGRNRGALAILSDRVREEYGVSVEVFAKDLSSHTAPDELFAELERKQTTSDVLVNNAGFAMQGTYQDNDIATLLDMIQVNITAVTHLTRLILPGMLQRGHGRILNISSVGAYMPGPLMAAYFASKAYVLSLSEALANELQGTGVTVTALCPGPTRSKFAIRAGLTDTRAFRGHLLEPASVAQAGLDAMMKGKSVVIAGLKHRMQLFPTPLVPRKVLAYFARQYHETPRRSHDGPTWPAASPDSATAKHAPQP
jgi:short-subunit dehydrogenase